jgi:CheY-like chemotaxis protein
VVTPRLLLADDSVTIRKVVELTFAGEGIEVTAVADGEAAMQKFLEIRPDILLLDTAMPAPDGYKLCEMIKQDEATRNIPVLLLVGSFEPFDQDEAERVCADGFLTKPFQSVRELVARVRELLGPEAFGAQTKPSETTTEAAEEYIDHEYKDSYAMDAPTQKFESVDELPGDSGMDDEMIEMVHLEHVPNENDLDLLGVSAISGQASKEFDWSPDAKVVGQRTQEQHVVRSSDDAGFQEPIEQETEHGVNKDEYSTVPPIVEAPADDYKQQIEKASEYEHGLMASSSDGPVIELGEKRMGEPTLVDDEVPDASLLEGPIEKTADGQVEPGPMHSGSSIATSRKEAPAEPSPEFISLVAKRVVEHLSDRVIREVAREVVPLITEKLIREALDEENKT